MAFRVRPRFLAAGSLAAGIAIAAVLTTQHFSNPHDARLITAASSQQIPPAEQAFVRAMVIQQQAGNPNIAQEPVVLSTKPNLATMPRTATALPPSLRSKTAVAAALPVTNARLGSAFTGAELRKEQSTAKTMLDANEAHIPVDPRRYPILNFNSGVSGVRVNSFSQNGSTATINAAVNLWAIRGQVQPGGKIALAGPANTILVQAQMRISDGTWRVSSMTWKFAPGSEP